MTAVPPCNRSAAHSAAVPATMAMITERITRGTFQCIVSGMRMAHMPM